MRKLCLLLSLLAGLIAASSVTGDLIAAGARETAGATTIGKSGLPLPRYVSLAKSRVNMRKGPGLRYPIDWVYTREDLPVEIIAEFDTWRQIRDWEGTTGWVHKNMLQGKRSVLVKEQVGSLRQNPSDDAAVVLRAEAGVIGRLLECAADWCRVEIAGTRGWLKSQDFYGVYVDEVVR